MKKRIINEAAYYKKVAENMRRKSRAKEKAGENHEPFNDDIYMDKNLEPIPLDEQFEKSKPLGWVEIMENPSLYKAITNLSKDEQILITHLLLENCTQQELADKYNVTQPSIYHKINKIKRKIKNYMCRK